MKQIAFSIECYPTLVTKKMNEFIKENESKMTIHSFAVTKINANTCIVTILCNTRI